jgi:hypothetical protein
MRPEILGLPASNLKSTTAGISASSSAAALQLLSIEIVKLDLTNELGTQFLDGKNSIKDLELKSGKERVQSVNSNCLPPCSFVCLLFSAISLLDCT